MSHDREIRVLRQKLDRAEANLRRLEDQREASTLLHVSIVKRLERSAADLEEKNRELIAAQERLAMSEQRATQASTAKSSFLANMSHELRTPLNAIIGYAELVEEELEGTDLCTDEMQRIRDAGAHLLSLIDQILDLSKVEAGRMEVDWQTVDLPLLVDGVAATFRPMLIRKGVELIVAVGAVPPVRTDRQKLAQVLINLLSNAVKFTPMGKVKVAVVRECDRVAFSVEDTGVGMTEEQLGRVFLPFEQADLSTTRRYGGTGLGLAIADRFCRLLGGELAVESQVGVGTTFRLSIPVGVSA